MLADGYDFGGFAGSCSGPGRSRRAARRPRVDDRPVAELAVLGRALGIL
jgi:hypothetical protein